MREDLPYQKNTAPRKAHRFPLGRSPRAFNMLIVGVLLSSCSAPKYRYSVDVDRADEEDLYLNSESIYYSMLVSASEEIEESDTMPEKIYKKIETNETTKFETLLNSLLANPGYSDLVIGHFEKRKDQALAHQAARVRARLEIAYCQTNPEDNKPLLDQWTEYSQRKYYNMMNARCDILVQSHIDMLLLTDKQISKIPTDFDKLSLIDQFTILSSRLDQIEYAYLLSTLQNPPMDDEARKVMNTWRALQIETESQLQSTIHVMILAGQLPKRRPGFVPRR